MIFTYALQIRKKGKMFTSKPTKRAAEEGSGIIEESRRTLSVNPWALFGAATMN